MEADLLLIDGYEVIKKGEYGVLQVTDNGPGITQQDFDRIFEPFYSKKKMGHNSGTGLGLAVVHGVVKDHVSGSAKML